MSNQEEIAQLQGWLERFEDEKAKTDNMAARAALELEAAALRRKLRSIRLERGKTSFWRS